MKKIFLAFGRWELNPRNSQKVGSDSEPSWGCLQQNRWAEHNFLQKRRSIGASALWFLQKKSEQAIKACSDVWKDYEKDIIRNPSGDLEPLQMGWRS